MKYIGMHLKNQELFRIILVSSKEKYYSFLSQSAPLKFILTDKLLSSTCIGHILKR